MSLTLVCLLTTASLLCGVLVTCCLSRPKRSAVSSPCETKPNATPADLSTVLIITRFGSGTPSVEVAVLPTCNVGRLLRTCVAATPHAAQKSARMASRRLLDVYS